MSNNFTQQNLIKFCDNFLSNYFEKIRITDINFILDCLCDSFWTAFEFNSNVQIRIQLTNKYIMKETEEKEIINLRYQQNNSIALYYQTLNKIYLNKKCDETTKLSKETSKSKIIIFSNKLLSKFVNRLELYVNYNIKTEESENETFISDIVSIISNYVILSLVNINFENESDYYDDLIKMLRIINVKTDNSELNIKLKDFI